MEQTIVKKSFPTFALVVLLLATFMDLVDTTIMNIALPSIQANLHTSPSAAQWTVDAYLLGLALIIITGGRLGDIFGRKKLFLVGVAGFTIASAFSGMAPTIGTLIVSRFLQGAMAAIMVPQVMSSIQVMFKPKERAAALGAYSAVMGFATVGGPLLSGFLISRNIFGLGWRPIFLINIPVGIFVFLAALKVLKESKSENPLRVDGTGILLASSALILLLYPLIEGYNLDWPVWTYISIAAAFVVAGILILYERNRIRSGKSSLIALYLFKFRSFTGGILVNTVFMLALSGYFLIFTFYLQAGLHYTPMRAALVTLPFSFMVPAMAGFSVMKLAPVLGRKVIMLGIFLCAVGIGGIELTLYGSGANLSFWHLFPFLILGGAGMGMVVAPLTDFSLAQVPVTDAGSASGLLNMMQQIGSCIGIAVLGSVFFNQIGVSFAFAGFASGARYALWGAAGILVLTIPCALLFPKPIHAHEEPRQ